MNVLTPLDRAANMLAKADYIRLPDIMLVAGLKLDFPAAFVPEKGSSDLILLSNIASDDDEATVIRKMNGIARALDVSRSRRSLTLVLFGKKPRSTTLETLSRVCRVLPIENESGDNDDAIRNWLAVLLPLPFLQTGGAVANPLARISTLAQGADGSVHLLIDLAAKGEIAVKKRLYHLIDNASSTLEGDQL